MPVLVFCGRLAYPLVVETAGNCVFAQDSSPVALADIWKHNPCQWLPPPLHTPSNVTVWSADTSNAFTLPLVLKLNSLPECNDVTFPRPVLAPEIVTYVLELYPDLPALNT